MHTMEQGHVWIPGLYGDTQAGLLHCWRGNVQAALITYLSTIQLPVVSAQQMGKNHCWLAASPGSFHTDNPGPLLLQKPVLFQVPELKNKFGYVITDDMLNLASTCVLGTLHGHCSQAAWSPTMCSRQGQASDSSASFLTSVSFLLATIKAGCSTQADTEASIFTISPRTEPAWKGHFNGCTSSKSGKWQIAQDRPKSCWNHGQEDRISAWETVLWHSNSITTKDVQSLSTTQLYAPCSHHTFEAAGKKPNKLKQKTWGQFFAIKKCCFIPQNSQKLSDAWKPKTCTYKKGRLPLMATQPQVRVEMDPQPETLQNHSTPHNWATPLLCHQANHCKKIFMSSSF